MNDDKDDAEYVRTDDGPPTETKTESETEEPWKLTRADWDQLTTTQRSMLERLEKLEQPEKPEKPDTTSQTPSTTPSQSASEKPEPPTPTEELAVETVVPSPPSDGENPPDENPDDQEKPSTRSGNRSKRRRRRLF